MIQVFLFDNVIEMKEMKLYNKLKKSKSLENKIKQKFQFLKSLDKLHNIIVHIHSSASHTAIIL